MKVLKLATVIDDSGNLHIDVPTDLSASAVDVVIILSQSALKNTQKKSYDFSDLAGRLKWQGDSVAMQRVLRDEW